MAWTVWKYPLSVTDTQTVSIPESMESLHVAKQGDVLTWWVRVDPSTPKKDRLVLIVGTGNRSPEPDLTRHLGSVFDGPFVWHVFDAGWL